MPLSLTPKHFDLHRFEGTWRGTESLAASPWAPAGSNDVAVTARVVVGGFAVVIEQVSSRNGTPLVSGHGVLSIDPETDEVTWHWFDSIGYPPLVPARGRWAGDQLVVERSTSRGTNRTTWKLDVDTIDQRVEFRAPDGEQFTTLIAGRLTREAPGA